MGPRDMSMLSSIRRTMLGPFLGNLLGISVISLLLGARNGSNFHWTVMYAK